MDNATWYMEQAKLVVTSAIAVIAAGFGIAIQRSQRNIAQRQADTAHQAKLVAAAKLNLDLFEKRMAIFDATWAVFPVAHQNEGLTDEYKEFRNAAHKAAFLLGRDVNDYLAEVLVKVDALRINGAMVRAQNDIARQNQQYNQSVGEAMAKLLLEQSELQMWLMEQAAPCKAVFGKYMDFSTWQ